MKKTSVILILINLITLLALAFTYQKWRKAEANLLESEMAKAQQALKTSVSEKVAPPAPPETSAGAADDQNKPFNWERVEFADYREYIANLRRIGCPDETIRDIIRADVNKLFQERQTDRPKYEYWRTGNMMADIINEDRIKEHQDTLQAKNDMLQELLGEEGDIQESTPYDHLAYMMDFLPDAKRKQLVGKLQGFQATAMKYVGNGSPDAQDLENLKGLREEIETELNSFLTPQEKIDYDLRLSNTAQMMRMTLGDFNPSEEEFKEIYELRRAFDDEHSVLGIPPVDEEGRERRKVAEKELENQVLELLGEDRFAEFERAPKQEYKSALKIVDRQGLPKENAIAVYEMKEVAENQADVIRQDELLSPAQREDALKAIRMETEVSIQEKLGEDGFQSYQSQRGGKWIKQLNPEE